MCTVGGHSKPGETMSIVGVPVMTKKSFIDTERDIGEMWKQALQQSMLEAGRREREIAIQKGHFHEGVLAITVIVDGGWSKRSHKHSYNAKSGVAIIIGKETGKLLHIGVRNKFCHACEARFQRKTTLATGIGQHPHLNGNRYNIRRIFGSRKSAQSSLYRVHWRW